VSVFAKSGICRLNPDTFSEEDFISGEFYHCSEWMDPVLSEEALTPVMKRMSFAPEGALTAAEEAISCWRIHKIS
jgi:hypothetical protein